MAAACGVYVKTISRKSTAEGWAMLDFRRPRIRTAHQALIAIAASAAAGDELDPVDEEAESEAAAFGAVEPVAQPEPWPDEPVHARIGRIAEMLTRHTETILRRVEVGLPLEGRQVAALSALVSLSERIAAMAREDAVREEKQSDEDLARTMRIIDMRIIYLARCEARQLCVELFGIPQAEVDAKLPEPEEDEEEWGEGE